MSYTNFKPTIWSKQIQVQLEKLMVLRDGCNTSFQGDVGMGKTVKIIGAGRPTVKTYVPGTSIDSPETPTDSSIYLTVDQYKYFNIQVDDVDQAQADVNIMKTYLDEGTRALAESADSYIAGLAAGATNISSSTSANSGAKTRAAIEAGLVTLWNNGVNRNDVEIVITPWMYIYLKNSITTELTDNKTAIEQGVLGSFNGAVVRISNNLYNDGTDDYMIIRTGRAIAFASGIEKTDAYRPDSAFSDAVKVLHTFGAKVVRQDELYVLKAHNS